MSLARSPACLFVTLLGSLLVQQSGLAGEPEQGYRRWAILGTSAVEETGLTDVLTAELSKRQGLELVERQALAAAAKELELSACFGSDAAGQRLRLGKLLGADALLLLALEERELLAHEKPNPEAAVRKELFITLVVSDCRYGARLRVEHYPYTAGRRDALSVDCARAVDEVRRQYAAGVRQVVGISPFLSKNLVPDYDHLQAGYSHLLDSSLTTHPGVAVLEIDEAQAIRQELDLTERSLKDRVVPLFVEGEFKMSSVKPGEVPRMDLSFRATDAKQVRLEVHKQGLTPSEVTQLLGESLPRQIVLLAQEKAVVSLDAKQQHAMLVRRADVFAGLGVYDHAVGLREAALLLQPDDIEQRLKAIQDAQAAMRLHDYRFLLQWIAVRNRIGDGLGHFIGEAPADVRAYREAQSRAFARRIATIHSTAAHLEYLFRHRLLNPREAHLVLGRWFWGRSGAAIAATEEQRLEEVETSRELIWRLLPLLPRLDSNLRNGRIGAALQGYAVPGSENRESTALEQYLQWAESAASLLAKRLPGDLVTARRTRKMDAERMFGDLFRFLTEVASPRIPLPFMASLFNEAPPGDLNSIIAQGHLKAEEVRAFYDRLLRTNQPLCMLYGRIGLLGMRVAGKHENPLDAQALREVDALLAIVREFDTGEREYRTVTSSYERYLGQLRKECQTTVGGITQTKRHPLPENPIPEFDARLEVTFEPVEGLLPAWLGHQKCTDSMDVVWTADWMDTIPEKGVFKRVFTVQREEGRREDQDRLLAPYWDGKNFWVACSKSGIHVISPSAGPLGNVGPEQGLPPYLAEYGTLGNTGLPMPWSGLVLHPIAPGKCLAIGKMGPKERVWMALLSQEESPSRLTSFHVKVLHTATKPCDQLSESREDDLEEVFGVAWLAEQPVSHAAAKRLLSIGRSYSRYVSPKGRHPLVLDLDTLGVSIAPARVPVGFGPVWFGADGRAVTPSGSGLDLLAPTAGEAKVWTRTPLLRSDPPRIAAGSHPLLLPYEGMLYQPGVRWCRVDPGTWKADRLHSSLGPYENPFDCYSVSAHYGLIAWNPVRGIPGQYTQPNAWAQAALAAWKKAHSLHQFAVRARPSESADLTMLYPGVPLSDREKHHQAVQALRRLGGSVATCWGLKPHRPTWNDRIEWRAVVYLSKRWTGGDAGLAHLEHLHNLRDLYLVQAPIGDEGLQAVGRARTLQTLHLVETRATNVGLAHLADLKDLYYLRLEGTVQGREFGDPGLKGLSRLPALEKLVLYGDTFTDEGLVALRALPRLQKLWLLNTKITKAGLSKADLLQRTGDRSDETGYSPDFD